MIVPASFITELLAQQSAVPVIGHNYWNELKPISQEMARIQYLHNHSPSSFNTYRYEDSVRRNFHFKSAAFGYATFDKKLGSINTIYKKLESFLQKKPPKFPTPTQSRSCIGFKIPFDELNKIFTTNILAGHIFNLTHKTEKSFTYPTFDHDPKPVYSTETLANTREGVLVTQEITNINEIRLKPITNKLNELIYTYPEGILTLKIDIQLFKLNLTNDALIKLSEYITNLRLFDKFLNIQIIKKLKIKDLNIIAEKLNKNPETIFDLNINLELKHFYLKDEILELIKNYLKDKKIITKDLNLEDIKQLNIKDISEKITKKIT